MERQIVIKMRPDEYFGENIEGVYIDGKLVPVQEANIHWYAQDPPILELRISMHRVKVIHADGDTPPLLGTIS